MVEQWTENPRVSGSIPLLNKVLFLDCMNISVINLLLKIKSLSLIQREKVVVSYNRQYIDILRVLYEKGFIQSFCVINNKTLISINLRYYYNKPIFKNFKIISKPSLENYIQVKDLYKLEDKKFVFFLSTSYGLLTSSECKRFGVGGKLLFMC